MILNSMLSGDGTPLVILHGLLGASANFGAITRTLEDQYQVIRLDLRNHGASPHASTMAYTELASDVIETLDALGVGQCNLLGHSMGGKAAMVTALHNPERVSRLIVVDMSPVSYPPNEDVVLEAMHQVDLLTCAKRSDVDAALAPLMTNKAVRQFVLTNVVSDAGELRWRVNLPVLRDQYAIIRGFPDLEPTFDGEAAFIYGSQSNYVIPEYYEAIAKLFPRHELVALEAGHWIHAEQPQAFVAEVKRFLCK